MRSSAVFDRRQTEVHEDHLAGSGDDDVRRLHVAVHDGRVMCVQVVESGGDLAEVVEDGAIGQSRVAALIEHLLEIRALDPVHDDHIAAVVEEVVPHER
jgi:hypothetical protein